MQVFVERIEPVELGCYAFVNRFDLGLQGGVALGRLVRVEARSCKNEAESDSQQGHRRPKMTKKRDTTVHESSS